MLSPRRRQVIIAGLGTAVAPAAFAALPAIEAPQKLLLCGRVLGSDGRPLSGAAVVSGQGGGLPCAGGGVPLLPPTPRAVADADGPFMLVTSTPHYRVSSRARATEGTVSNSRPDADGMGRASIGLTLV